MLSLLALVALGWLLLAALTLVATSALLTGARRWEERAPARSDAVATGEVQQAA